MRLKMAIKHHAVPFAQYRSSQYGNKQNLIGHEIAREISVVYQIAHVWAMASIAVPNKKIERSFAIYRQK